MTDVEPFVPPRFCQAAPAGGRIGPNPEHFIVEEIQAYPLSGKGEHAFFWIEKRGLNTQEVAKRLARAAGTKERDVGFAGMKDRNAVTRQWFSLVHDAKDAATWDLGEGVSILSVTRHSNKLRTGHLIGNRFSVTLVDVEDAALEKARAIAQILGERGLPNFYGAQRFGRGGENLRRALDWVQRGSKSSDSSGLASNGAGSNGGAADPRASKRRKKGKSRFDDKLYPSVIQSEIFNRYLSARLARTEELLVGEVVRLRGTGSSFVVEDLEKELPRYRARDLCLTGPMIGPKGLQAEGEARALEVDVRSQLRLGEEELAFLARHAPGARRDLMLETEALEVALPRAGQLLISFQLPAGAYATQVIAEFTGTGPTSLRNVRSEKEAVT